MSNTLTGLLPVLYEGLDEISREMIGFANAVTINAEATGAAVDEEIRYPIAPAATTGNITAAEFPVDDGDQTIAYGTMTLDKAKYSPIRWNGEEELAVGHTGQHMKIVKDQFKQSVRALVNLVEVDLAALHVGASRSSGLAGTAPFATASNFANFAAVNRILDENGAPQTERQLVLGAAAIANLRGVQSSLFKANEAGTADLLRRGIIGQVEGLDIHNSHAVTAFTAGTGTNYTSSTAGFAVGTTSIAIITGSGTVLAGDNVTFTGDTNIYVVTTGVSAPGTIVIAKPGLRVALAASAVAMTIGAAHTPNLGFHKSAIQLCTRTPAMPAGGDLAVDVADITDPISGITLQVAKYLRYRRVRYEVGLVWGTEVSKPEWVTKLLG